MTRLRCLPWVRIARCLCVSFASTLLSAIVLVVLAVLFGVAASTANVIAVICGIGPSYVANRHWVWRNNGRGSWRREVLPFWVMSLAGLALSTLFVSVVAAATNTWSASTRSLALPFANASAFGALWVVQFLLLDRVIFARSKDQNPWKPQSSTATR